jgi:hypothetical protein
MFGMIVGVLSLLLLRSRHGTNQTKTMPMSSAAVEKTVSLFQKVETTGLPLYY